MSLLLLLGTVGLFLRLTGAQIETTLKLPQDAGNIAFRFLPSENDWKTGEYGKNDSSTNCGRWTYSAGASVTIDFHGNYFRIYGDIPGINNTITATVDHRPLNISWPSKANCEELMWQADPSELPLGQHQIVATCIGDQYSPLVIDRVVFGTNLTGVTSASPTAATSTTTINPSAIVPLSSSSPPPETATSTNLTGFNPFNSSSSAGAATSTISNNPTAILPPLMVPRPFGSTTSITSSVPRFLLPSSTLPLSSEPDASASSAVPTAPPLNEIPAKTDGVSNKSTISGVSSTRAEAITTPSPQSTVGPVDYPTPTSVSPTAFVPSEITQTPSYTASDPVPSSDSDSNGRSGSPSSAADQSPPSTSPDGSQTSSPAASSTSLDADENPPGAKQSSGSSDPAQQSNTPSAPTRSSATSSPNVSSSGNQGDSDRSQSPSQPSSSSSTLSLSENTQLAHEASPTEATPSTPGTPNMMSALHSGSSPETTSMAQVVASGLSAQQDGPMSTTDPSVVGSSQLSSADTPSQTPGFPTSLAPLTSASSSQSVTMLSSSIAKPSATNTTSTGVISTNSSTNGLPIGSGQTSHKHKVAVITGSTIAGAFIAGVLIACAAYAATHREWIYYLVGSTLFALGVTGFGYHARRLIIKRGRGITLPDTKIALIVTVGTQTAVLDRNTIIWHTNIVSETCNQFLVDVPCSHKKGSSRLFFGTFTDEGSRAIVDSCAEAPAVIREEQGHRQWHHDQPSSSSEGSEPPVTARNETSVPLSIVLGTGTKVVSGEKDPNMIPFLQIPEESFRSGETYEAPGKLYLHAYRVPSDCESGQFGDRLNASHILRDSLTGDKGIEIDQLKPLTAWVVKPGKEGELKLEIGSSDREDLRKFRHECKIRKSAEFIRGTDDGYKGVGSNTEVA